jgi:hypothetical protein
MEQRRRRRVRWSPERDHGINYWLLHQRREPLSEKRKQHNVEFWARVALAAVSGWCYTDSG